MIKLFLETDKGFAAFIKNAGTIKQKYVDVDFNYQIIVGIKNIGHYRIYEIETRYGDIKHSSSREYGY